MKTLIYDAPANHVLFEDGEEIHGGEEVTVTDQRALELLADTSIRFLESERELGRLTRTKLNGVAEKAGVESPVDLSSKDAVIAAIDAASQPGVPSQPAAEGGEGLDNNQEA